MTPPETIRLNRNAADGFYLDFGRFCAPMLIGAVMLANCLFVGCGGFVGSILRYLCGLIETPITDFPLITLGINFVGSFAIMFFAGIFATSFPIDERWMLFLRVGLCGGFTTFSTFSAETLLMIESGDTLLGAAYAVVSCALCVAAAFLGEIASSALAVS